MLTPPRGTEEELFFGAYMLKKITLNPGHKTSMHYHRCKTETLYVLEGSVRIMFDSDLVENVVLEPGQSYTISEGICMAHRMSCVGTIPVVYLEASTPHRTDNERLYL
jgi:uncharacterized cupin superfamily protein